jgi:hypothetical protein
MEDSNPHSKSWTHSYLRGCVEFRGHKPHFVALQEEQHCLASRMSISTYITQTHSVTIQINKYNKSLQLSLKALCTFLHFTFSRFTLLPDSTTPVHTPKTPKSTCIRTSLLYLESTLVSLSFTPSRMLPCVLFISFSAPLSLSCPLVSCSP